MHHGSRLILFAGALALPSSAGCAHGGAAAGTDAGDGDDDLDATTAVSSDAAPAADAGAADAGVVDAAATDAAPALADAAPDASPGGAVLVVPTDVGDSVVGTFELPATPKTKRLTVNSCTGTSLTFSSAATSFRYIELRNPSATVAVLVSVWTHRAPSGPIIDTIVAAYPGATLPSSDAARLECLVGVEQGCTSGGDATACVTEDDGRDWAGLIRADGRGVTIAPGGSVTLYVAAYEPDESGALRVSARTEAWP